MRLFHGTTGKLWDDRLADLSNIKQIRFNEANTKVHITVDSGFKTEEKEFDIINYEALEEINKEYRNQLVFIKRKFQSIDGNKIITCDSGGNIKGYDGEGVSDRRVYVFSGVDYTYEFCGFSDNGKEAHF